MEFTKLKWKSDIIWEARRLINIQDKAIKEDGTVIDNEIIEFVRGIAETKIK